MNEIWRLSRSIAIGGICWIVVRRVFNFQQLRRITVAIGLTATLWLDCYAASNSNEEWKTECVGQVQLSLPGVAEIASTPRQYFDRELSSFKRKNYGYVHPFKFSDGQAAAFSILSGVAVTLVSQPLDSSTIRELWVLFQKDRAEVTSRLKADLDPDVRKRKVTRILAANPNVEASLTERYATALADMNGRLVRINTEADKSLPSATYESAATNALQSVLENTTPREFASIPTEQGLCLPYLFIKNKDKVVHEIAMTYRLIQHPDVTILLKDSTAATHPNKEVLTAKYRTNDFWGQYSGGKTDFKSAWWPVARDVTLAGQKGMQTFVQFVREDGRQDYGYLAVAPGDPDAKDDVPDLMLYVMREAKNATSKGIEPMDKESFIETAKAIAASVKRRPTNL